MRHRALSLIGPAAILVACSLVGDDTANGGLAFTSWTVISIDGQPTAPAGVGPTMTFAADGTVSGSGGCNQYSGQFHTEGDRIAFGQVSSTLMGCDGQRGQVEALFLKALDGASTWRQTEAGELEIGGDLTIVARPGIAPGVSIVPGWLPSVTSWSLGADDRPTLGGHERRTLVRG